MFRSLFLRAETYPNEQRTPLVPSDIEILKNAGIRVIVQSSPSRIFPDSAYAAISGVEVTTKDWFDPEFNDCFIVGIKQLSHLTNLDHHRHLYFSHSFKGQDGSTQILQHFQRSQSKLYDCEFLTDAQGKRLIAFGFFAGLVGGALGLLQVAAHQNGSNLGPLKAWNSFEELMRCLPHLDSLSIALIGPNGRCGKGVQTLLASLGLQATQFTRENPPTALEAFDLIYNCIQLEESHTDVWITKDTQFHKPTIVVDISCDASKPNNPIAVYTSPTTWDHPVDSPLPNLSIIAIENLPSLLPRESSIAFSNSLTTLLKKDHEVFDRALAVFEHALNKN